MKFNNLKITAIAVLVALTAFNCSSDDDNAGPTAPTGPDFTGTYVQRDQMARPAINTVFVPSGRKDLFNVTTPSNQGAEFQPDFLATLMAVNPGYTTNALTWDATTFTTALATDVLTVSRTQATTFGTLKGRGLADDVIDTELTLIFGGPNGMDNPSVTSDGVDANDKTFLTAFPYLAAPTL